MILSGYKVLDENFHFVPLTLTYEDKIIGMEPEETQEFKGYIIPGLVDVHTHGVVGQDAMIIENYEEYIYYMYSKGITTFYPTSVTATDADMEEMVLFFKDKKEIKGLNIEGPYLNAKMRGAHVESLVREGDIGFLYRLQELSGNKIKLITVAPEIGQNLEFIAKASEMGIKVSLGHTACDYETAVTAFNAGADHVTHLFNAMNPLHHRKSGLIGAAFDKPFYVEIIGDGIHVVPEVVRMAYKLLGSDRMILISDCMAATGLEDGEYMLGDMHVTVEDSIARTDDGALAGSTSTVYDMVRSVSKMGIPLEEAVRMATETPAKSVNETDIGILKPGMRADFVILDKDFEVVQTVKDGQIVYSAY
ncbi:MAG: N-acetylglucosamine-6-phosphate deacetylase [Clostridia bacterium]|nr:N-acetylglucosamine-6-phosphate deacetylase [Clostridia bacterium]